MISKKELNSYLKQVNRNCPTGFRRKMMPVIKDDVLDFLDGNPDSNINDVISRFGSPEKFALECLMSIDETERTRVFKKSKWIKAAIIISVAVFILATIVTAVYIIKEN